MSELLTINYDKKPCYNIVFDTSFDGLSDSVAELGFNGRKIAVITDSNVKPLYGDEVVSILKSVSDKVFIYEIPAGENNKNLSEINKIYSFLIENHFDRHDLLVALGGGVVGDESSIQLSHGPAGASTADFGEPGGHLPVWA